jgi:hypothetical protein
LLIDDRAQIKDGNLGGVDIGKVLPGIVKISGGELLE